MKYLSNPSTDPHYNMSFDEYCLERLSSDDPVFYLWQNRPSVIIGLNQNAYREVNLPYLREKGIVLARRVTGGGAVYHDLQNLNYTIVGRSRDLARDYADYTHLIADALRQLGVPAELTGRNDIFVEGRKVSGYAKRLYKDRLMVHGTLMYQVDLDVLGQVLAAPEGKLAASGIASVHSRVANLKDYLPAIPDIGALRARLHGILAGADGEIRLSEEDLAAIRRQAEEKFATWEWNWSHSPAAGMHCARKYPCGQVEADFSIRDGRIRGLRFSGDFLGSVAPDSVAAALEGCRCRREDLALALASVRVEDAFDALSAEDLLALFGDSLL